MLQRPISAPVWSPVRRIAARLGAATGPFSGLLRYVLIVGLLCAVGCVYLWQVNDLSTIHDDTAALQLKAQHLEEQNVTLAIQLAQWNSPAYVDRRSGEEGYVAAAPRTITAPAAPQIAVGPAAPQTAAP